MEFFLLPADLRFLLEEYFSLDISASYLSKPLKSFDKEQLSFYCQDMILSSVKILVYLTSSLVCKTLLLLM